MKISAFIEQAILAYNKYREYYGNQDPEVEVLGTVMVGEYAHNFDLPIIGVEVDIYSGRLFVEVDELKDDEV